MNNDHIKALLQGIAPVIKQAIEDATKPLRDEIEALKQRALEKGDKGDSVTVDDVRPMLAEMVAALPKAEPGRDADPEVTARLVADEVQKAVAALPAPVPGKSITVDDVKSVIDAAVAQAVAALPVPKNGESVTVEQLAPLVQDTVAKAVAALPAAEPGKSVTADDVRPMLAELVAALPKAEPGKDGVGLAGAVIDREGGLVVTLTDGSQRDLGRVVGKDAEPGKPGLDGLGFDDLSVEYDGERTFKIAFIRDERRKEIGEFVIPSMIYRGVWREGAFKAGDVVTLAGSLFVARKDTATKPETQSTDWTLAAKRGKDGHDAKPIDVGLIERRSIDVTKKYIDERFDQLGAFPRRGG